MTEEELLRGEIKFYRLKLTELSEENKKLNKLREKYNEQYNIIKAQQAEIEKKDKMINNAITEIETLRTYFSVDLQPDFFRILEILKDKNVIYW